MKLLFLFGAFLILNLGCGQNILKQTDIETTVITTPKNPEALGISENPDMDGWDQAPWYEAYHSSLVNRLNQFQVQCHDEDCPSSLATFVGTGSLNKKNQRNLNICGATVFEEQNLILSARHCFHRNRLEKGMSCEDQGYFIFPAVNNLPARVIPCLSVEDFSGPEQIEDSSNQRQVDWILFRMAEGVPDRVATVNRKGLKDNQPVNFYRYRYSQETKTVDLLTLDCSNKEGSHYVPTSHTRITPIHHIQCTQLISKGYSGYPYFNRRHELVGVQSQNLFHGEDPIKLHSKNTSIASSTCIGLGPEDKKRKRLCQWVEESLEDKKKRWKARHLRTFAKQGKQKIKKWLRKNNNHPLKWEPVNLKELLKLPQAWQKSFGSENEPGCAEETYLNTPLPFPENLKRPEKTRKVSSDGARLKKGPTAKAPRKSPVRSGKNPEPSFDGKNERHAPHKRSEGLGAIQESRPGTLNSSPLESSPEVASPLLETPKPLVVEKTPQPLKPAKNKPGKGRHQEIASEVATPDRGCNTEKLWQNHLKLKKKGLLEPKALGKTQLKKAISERRQLFENWRSAAIEKHFQRMNTFVKSPMIPKCVNTSKLKEPSFDPGVRKKYSLTLPILYVYYGVSWADKKFVGAYPGDPTRKATLIYNPSTKLFNLQQGALEQRPPLPKEMKEADLLGWGSNFMPIDIHACP